MKIKHLILSVGCLFIVGCASMPVIGPCSYVAAKSNEPAPGLAAGEETFWQSTWKATKAILGYAGDSFLYVSAANEIKDRLDSDDAGTSGTTINGNFYDSVLINSSGSGTVSVQNESDKGNQ